MEVRFNQELERFRNAATLEEQDAAMQAINRLRAEYETMSALAQARYTVDTTDAFYKAEQDFYDETNPHVQGMVTRYYEALIQSRFRPQLEEKWGKHLFNLAELAIRTFSPEVVEDLQQENKLCSEYVQLIASAKIPFEGEERTLAQLVPFTQSPDRDIRKRSVEARFGFFQENEEKLDNIYDQLVKVRTRIARKLGFSSFVELAYARLSRTDYNADMVANFRKQVLKHIVPIATQLRERQRERIGVDTLYFYDESFQFRSGNPTPKGGPEWMIENAQKMYAELSPETDEFFRFMTEKNLMDLVAKKGKAAGGYCTFFRNFQAPFIFANFNGTSHDVDVLTHEAGHAFQVYQSRTFQVPEYTWPTLEACEIHSMSMEFLTWPWMELFFQEDTEKYKFTHLSSRTLLFLPYGVAVDEFQHFVYEHPEATPAERKQKWREIEQKYLPHRNYAGIDFLERGGFWQQQGHIYEVPFYYIDYTLAQMCAFQFWKRAQENRKEAWADYVNLCKLGGSKPFLELVQEANLLSPFEDGCVESVIGPIVAYLNSVDDKKL